MKLVGQILKKNREAKKYTLLDISNELKISEEILRNIENSQFQDNIDIVFIIGHLRSYSSFLNLDYIDLVTQFKKEQFPENKKKYEIERPVFQNKFFLLNKIFSFSLIIVIFSTFYILFIKSDNPSREYAIIPDLPENYISIVEKANINNFAETKKIKINEEINFAKIEINSNSSSAIASTPQKDNKNSLIITLKLLDDAWVQLRDKNDEIIFSQLMNKNDEYSYDLDTNYSITSGNAGHILVLIDEKVRGKIGKKGEVVDSLVLNKDFNN